MLCEPARLFALLPHEKLGSRFRWRIHKRLACRRGQGELHTPCTPLTQTEVRSTALLKAAWAYGAPSGRLMALMSAATFLNVYCNSAAYLVLVLELQMECGAWKPGPGCQCLILRHVALTTPHSLPPEHSVLTERSDTLQYFTSATHARS